MPPLYNAYEAKILKILHSKLCKENKRKMISLSWATCPHILTLVYFHGRPTHTLPIVYFHGRPAHTLGLPEIPSGDLIQLERKYCVTWLT